MRAMMKLPGALLCVVALAYGATDPYHIEQDAAAASSYWLKAGNKAGAQPPPKLELTGAGEDPPSCKKGSGCGKSPTPSYNHGPLRPTKLPFRISDVPDFQSPSAEFDIGSTSATTNRVFRESIGYLYARTPSGRKLKCTGALVNINNIDSEPPVIVALVPGHCVFDADSRCERNDNYEFQTSVYTWRVAAVHHLPAAYTCTESRSVIRKSNDYALVQLEHSHKACVPDWDRARAGFYGGPSPCPWAMAIDAANYAAPAKAFAIGRSTSGTIVGASVRPNREGGFLRIENDPIETIGGPIVTDDYVVCGITNLVEKSGSQQVVFASMLDGVFGTVVSRANAAIKAERAKLPKTVETGGLDPELGQRLLCGGLIDRLAGAAGGDSTGLGGTFKQLLCNNRFLRR